MVTQSVKKRFNGHGCVMIKNKLSVSDKNICIVAPGALPLLSEKEPKNIIGPDVHMFVLINELLKHGFNITCITSTKDEAGPVNLITKIDIIVVQEKSYRFRVLYIISKALAFWNAMQKADADVYFHAGGTSGIVSLFCRVMNKKFVHSIASDALVNRTLISRKIKEFSRSRLELSTLSNWLDIKLADALIVQSEYQKELLKKNFHRNGILIKMPFPIVTEGFPCKVNPLIIMWVGAMAEVKQPEIFVTLAEAIPEASFQMIGGHSGNQEFYDRIKDAAGKIPNLSFLGVVPFNEIDEYYMRASVLVNTSLFEGFPNAFIQAWMHYVPVVSLNADPDELICNNKMGFHSKTFKQMVKDLRILLNNEKMRGEMGRNGREYVEREHNINVLICKYIEIFDL